MELSCPECGASRGPCPGAVRPDASCLWHVVPQVGAAATNSYICDDCSATFDTNADLLEHECEWGHGPMRDDWDAGDR